MGYIVGAIAGVAAGLACVLAVGGIPGIISGLAVAALLYVGAGQLLKPERRLAGVAASMLPDGEAASERIDAAYDLVRAISARRGKVRDGRVAREIDDLIRDIQALIACVEEQPTTYRRLAHFLSTYADQCLRMLDGYLGVERMGTPALLEGAHEDALDALAALQGVAQGELARATGRRAAEVETSSDAIVRLMEMDGYLPDRSGGAGADTKRRDAAPASDAMQGGN